MYKSLLLIWFLFVPFALFAQTDSTAILIGEVPVVSRIEHLNSKNNIQKIDSLILAVYNTESLAVLLSQNANISIKQYGVSGISTLSIRGGSSYHTAVIWNGFNIQDALNGGFNFTLAPGLIADDIQIKYGGSSAVFGSGAMGGSILLNNKADFNTGFQSETNLSAGSFGKQNYSQSFSFGNKKISLALKAFYNKTDNDFSFTNIAKSGFPTETLQNAAMEQYGALFKGYLKINKQQTLSTQYWGQYNYTEVPPNMISVGEDYAEQYDHWHRWTVQWTYKDEKWSFDARNGLFYSYLNYINNSINLDALHTSLNNITELIANWRIYRKTSFEIAVNNNFISAESDNFPGTKQQNRLAFFTSLKTKYLKNTVLNLNTRLELIDGEIQPVTFGLFGEYNFSPHYSVNLNVSKNHRSPTFNDLYWSGAFAQGNPLLKDETGYSADLSLVEKHSGKKFSVYSKATIYYSIVSDMIQWIPVEGIWTPQNQKEVQSWGFEFTSKYKYKFNENNLLSIDANYTYTNAQTTKKSTIESDDVLYKQLIYTPYHQANVFISYAYKKCLFSLNNEYTGEQYTRADNSDSIDGYFLMNFSAAYRFSLKKMNYRVYAKINNVLNTEYMQMQWYPMPPVNCEIGIKIIIN